MGNRCWVSGVPREGEHCTVYAVGSEVLYKGGGLDFMSGVSGEREEF